MRKLAKIFVGSFALLIGCSTAFASEYNNIVTFGDSLSDNGNIGRFTDGPIWVELLAQNLSATLYDYAYGGATTGYLNPFFSQYSNTGLLSQIGMAGTTLTTLSPSNSLVTVWAGANDLQTGVTVQTAVNNIQTALTDLYTDGMRNFLVPNLPAVGNTPRIQSEGATEVTYANDWSIQFNVALEQMLLTWDSESPGVSLYTVDAYSIFNQYQVGSTQWANLFWTVDGFHPDAEGHELIAAAAEQALNPTPEPATMFLFGIGVVGLVSCTRRKEKLIDYIKVESAQ
jgi:phospholipase/lecithinase/hemolysin